MTDIKKDEKCDCAHEVAWVVTIGDGCMHVTPHPSKKDWNGDIKPSLKELIAKLDKVYD